MSAPQPTKLSAPPPLYRLTVNIWGVYAMKSWGALTVKTWGVLTVNVWGVLTTLLTAMLWHWAYRCLESQDVECLYSQCGVLT
eukprot:1368037-Amorphochlora_amoeboformis.AAC.1